MAIKTSLILTSLAVLLVPTMAGAEEGPNPAPPPPPSQGFAFDAEFGQFPWVALLEWESSFCSGVVIHPRFVLTAAHCLDGNGPPTVKLRDIERFGTNHQVINGLATYLHPNYAGLGDWAWDIGLVELEHTAYASAIAVPTSGPPEIQRLASWGVDETDVAPDILQWADYWWTGNATGPFVFNSFDGANACPGDSGGGYSAVVEGERSVTAIHVANNAQACADATSFTAVPTHVEPIRDFITDTVGNLDYLESFGATERDRLHLQPPLSDTWVGHAMLWKAHRQADTHTYFPDLPLPDVPVDCDWDPAEPPNAIEASRFVSNDGTMPNDPPGSWGCYEVEDVSALYLGAAYSLYRWGSPAYVQASNGAAVALDRLTFETFDSFTGEPVSLLEACAWDFAPPLTAQAAADLCDTDTYDIVLHLVDGIEFHEEVGHYTWCINTFHDNVQPGPDIVFDPPMGEVLVSTAELEALMPELLAPRATKVAAGEALSPAELEARQDKLPPLEGSGPVDGPLPTAEAERHEERIKAPPPPPGGFWFDDDCTLP